MVVYWDLAALWNFAVDYLLLLCTLRLAGRPVRRKRLIPAAALGAAYSVAALKLPFPPWMHALALLALSAAAFAGTGRYVKLTLLFLLLSCGLGGGVLLLGACFGGLDRLARGILYARIPWGVFFLSGGLAYLLLSVVFRGAAKHDGGDLLHAVIEREGKRAEVTLFRDTGNTLSDPMTGEGVPVVARNALGGVLPETLPVTLRCRTVGDADGTLGAFHCDRLLVQGKDYGARLIAVSPHPIGNGGYQGLWFGETENGARPCRPTRGEETGGRRVPQRGRVPVSPVEGKHMFAQHGNTPRNEGGTGHGLETALE